MTVLSTIDGRPIFECVGDLRYTIREAARRNLNFTDIDLRGADLRGIDLQEAKLCGVWLTGACLINADLRYANLGGSVLQNVDFTGANLEMASMADSDVRGANFQHTNMDGCSGYAALFTGADFRGATDFGTGDFTHARFLDADLTDQPWPIGADALMMPQLRNSINTLNLDQVWHELSLAIQHIGPPPGGINRKPSDANRQKAMRWLAKLIFDDACSYEELREAGTNFALRLHPQTFRTAPEIIMAIRHPRTAKHPMAVNTIAHMRGYATAAFKYAQLPYDVPLDREWYINNYVKERKKRKTDGQTENQADSGTLRRDDSRRVRRQ